MYKVGYTQGVFDMFHIGHLHLINRAAEQCEKLIVGVNSDDLVAEYKNKKTVICQEDRAEIIRNLKSVDECVIVTTLNKVELYKQLKFDAVFIGDDWKGNDRWEQTEQEVPGDSKSLNHFTSNLFAKTPQISSPTIAKASKMRIILHRYISVNRR